MPVSQGQSLTGREVKRFVFRFGLQEAQGDVGMKELLGGKGANLAQMCRIGIPVPPGFTISTESCAYFGKNGFQKTFELLEDQVQDAVKWMEQSMGTRFGDPQNPLLLSVRSGARVSMPGMMDTVLNLGLNEEIVEGLCNRWQNERFAWDSYRRLIQMYGNVVLGMKPQRKEDEDPFEVILDQLKEQNGHRVDGQMNTRDLKKLVRKYKDLILKTTGKHFPDDPWQQLWSSIMAVFGSWSNDRAKVYREINHIPHDWGTAVNVQVMVYGNLNENSATGVAFTRDAATGEDLFNGEFLVNAQGEDVVAGIRTPQQITLEGSRRWAALAKITEEERGNKYPSLEEMMPGVYAELMTFETLLENHYREMQDLEFTIQDGKLWILQTRTGKRTGMAMVRIAMEMVRSGMINEETALLRMDPERLNDLLLPVFDQTDLKGAYVIARGLPASPGAAAGHIVFFSDEVETWRDLGKDVILVRNETSPEDLRGMHIAKGILTSRGGMTSHAAVVARGMGKCCVSGAGSIKVNYNDRTLEAGKRIYKEGDWISLNGSTGEVYEGRLKTSDPIISEDVRQLLSLADQKAKMNVRANADTPQDAFQAREFGAKGIGLCRTEHMFFADDRIDAMREMILAGDQDGRKRALSRLLPMQRSDFREIFQEMDGFPVTIRLLDPPLHEFLPDDPDIQRDLAAKMNVDLNDLMVTINRLREINPMMGHRGCRLSITFPEIAEMQSRAVFEAAIEVKKKGISVLPEVMIPLVGSISEFRKLDLIIRDIAKKVFQERGESIEFKVGTMIEVPRAALLASEIAEGAEFFSFGTNDLTQFTYGLSRDDAGKFLSSYLDQGLFPDDPFEVLDEKGVGRLIKIAAALGRVARPELKVGICGEHGGNPQSIYFCQSVDLDYVSCSPYRVPVARIAAAKAALLAEKQP